MVLIVDWFKRLRHPEYGGKYVTVKPTRWWSPRARHSARLAAQVAEYQALDTAKIISDMAIYGFALTDSSGRRISPTAIRPSR